MEKKNKALNTSTNHKLRGFLCVLTRLDFLAEVFNRILSLLNLRAEKGVLFKAGFILDNDHRNAHSFKALNGVNKMLGKAAGIAVEDDGLCCNFHNIVDGSETGGHINKLNVGFALGGTVAKAGNPHGVELIGFTFLQHGGVFGNEPGYSAVCL